MDLRVKNKAEKAEIYIYGDIVDDAWNFGWSDCNDPNVYPLEIKDMLKEVGEKDVDVHINSGGGHVFAGMAIANILKTHKGKTTCIVDGLAASAASVIALACDEVTMPANSFLMIHKPMNFVTGNAAEMRKEAETLDLLQEQIVSFYLAKAVDGVDEKKLNELVNEETWLSGTAAKEVFKITVIDEVKALNCTTDLFKNYSKIPETVLSAEKETIAKKKKEEARELELKRKTEETKISTMKKQIEIALAIN